MGSSEWHRQFKISRKYLGMLIFISCSVQIAWYLIMADRRFAANLLLCAFLGNVSKLSGTHGPKVRFMMKRGRRCWATVCGECTNYDDL
jgi:hypothetical protein